MKDLLSFNNVSIFYALPHGQEVCAINNFSYSFKEGKKYAIIGYSGSGKSTLITTITGSLVFDGEIFLKGKDIESVPIKDRSISFVNQQFSLFPHLTIYDNIIFPLRNDKADHEYADERVKEIAKKLNLYFLLTRKPKMISIGQAARVAIAKAIIHKRDLMIFDEPLANLDVLMSKRTLKVIKEYANEYKSTVIFVTHDVQEALNIADQILVLDKGTLIGDFTPMEFLHSKNEVVSSLREGLVGNEKD